MKNYVDLGGCYPPRVNWNPSRSAEIFTWYRDIYPQPPLYSIIEESLHRNQLSVLITLGKRVIIIIIIIITMSHCASRRIRPPRYLTNTFCLVQPLWRGKRVLIPSLKQPEVKFALNRPLSEFLFCTDFLELFLFHEPHPSVDQRLPWRSRYHFPQLPSSADEQ